LPTFFKNKKTLKNVKNVTKMKKRKKNIFYVYGVDGCGGGGGVCVKYGRRTAESREICAARDLRPVDHLLLGYRRIHHHRR